MRDPKKLNAFVKADALVLRVYEETNAFPTSERFGLQSQIRRAAVSVPTNLVEGCVRPSTREYLHFVRIAIGSASETRYLLSIATRLGLIRTPAGHELMESYADVIRPLQSLVTTLSQRDLRRAAPDA